jgi:PAS domain S-box-containing protein
MRLPPIPGALPPAPSPEELASPAGQLLERSAAATALIGLDGRLTYVNPAFVALWGFASGRELIGREATGDFWTDSAAACAAVSALRSQPVWQGELTARRADGKAVPVRATAQLLADSQGQPTAVLGNFVDISAEREARDAWRAEREFTELVVGGAGVLVAAMDEDGRFVRFNRECERASGWAAHDILGRLPWETVLPPEVARTVHAEAFLAAMIAADPGRTTHYTNEWVSRSGERRLIEWTNRVVLSQTDQRRFMIAVGVDVTARRAAEQALVRSEAELRAAQAVARMGSWALDIPSGRLDWSDEVFHLFEIDKARFEASYEYFLSAIHPDDQQSVAEAYARSLRTREPYRVEHRLLMPDGRVKWVEECCETRFDDAGRPMQSRGTVQDITERHLREVELQRFQLMVEHAPEEVWLTDEDSRVVYANAAACESLGYEREQLIGMCVADLDTGGPAAVGAIVEAVNAHRFSGRGPEGFRIQHRAADGRLVPKELHATAREIDGRRFGIAFARDISERLRIEEALAAREALLLDALDTYPGWVSCVDEQMRYVFVNSQFARKVGRSPAEIIGRTADEIMGVEGSAQRRAMLKRLIAGERSAHEERRSVDANGRERFSWIEYRVSEASGPDGRRLFYAFATDITELRQAQQRLTTVTQDIGVGLWEWDCRAGSIEFNDELLALGGRSATDVPDNAARWLNDLVEPAHRPRRRQLLQDVMSGRQSRSVSEFAVEHRDGHSVWVQEMLRVVSRDADGQPLRVIGALQDVSALKQREAELEALNTELETRIQLRTTALEQARQEAERANAAKSEFLSQMSHELRTPLNAIIGFGQLLELSDLPREDAEHVQEVMRAGRHLLHLIDEILDLASVESGRVRLRQQRVSLAPLVFECTRLMAPVAQAAGITLETMDLPHAAAVQADAGRLKQVLLNLLSNAIKYNRRGGHVRVSVAACDDDGVAGWELYVADTGAGLTAGEIGRLFRPFERLGAERSAVQGTGIGLALSRRLMELMDGTLGVSSLPGQGSTFRLCLPRADPGPGEPDHPVGDAGHAPTSGTAMPERRRRVLYVEDNEANQRLLVRLLARRNDVELKVAPTAREALALTPGWRPALLLIDIQLPDGDGHALLRDLRALGVQAPAVAVSANAMPADLARGRASSFVDYLTKPLDLARVMQVIDECMSDHSEAGPTGPTGRGSPSGEPAPGPPATRPPVA